MIVLAALAWADHRSWFYYQGGDWRRYHGRSFTVVDVLDGDTIAIDVADGQFATTRIRLWGVDAPESSVAETGQPAQPFADTATDFTRERCFGRNVRLQLQAHSLRGHFGRLLAYVLLPDGSMLNEHLLAAGLAHAEPRFEHELMDRFVYIAQQARHDRIGLWADQPANLAYPSPIDSRDSR